MQIAKISPKDEGQGRKTAEKRAQGSCVNELHAFYEL